MKQVLLLVTIGAACTAAGLYVGEEGLLRAKPRPGGTSEVRAAGSTVTSLGRLEPADGIFSVGAPVGSRVATLSEGLTEGQTVRRGDVLAVLLGYDEGTAEIALIDAQIAETKDQQKLIEESRKVAREKARIELLRLDRFAALELKAQKSRVALLEANRAQSRADLNRMAEVKGRSVSMQEYQRQELLVRSGEEELASAGALTDKLLASQEIDHEKLELGARESELELKKLDSALHLESLSRQKRLAEAKRDQALVRAPVAGRVLKIFGRPGETVGPKGILQLGDTSRMLVVAEVYETSVGKVRPGQSAEITSPTLPRTLAGRVERVGLTVGKNDVLGLDPASDAYARVVEVRILILGEDDARSAADFSNLQVNVTIRVAKPPAMAAPEGKTPAATRSGSGQG